MPQTTPVPSPTSLPRTIVPVGRAVRSLRGEIEAVTGRRVSFAPGGALAVPERALAPGAETALLATVRGGLRIGPGPLTSPYDGPATGLASLRVTWNGLPFGGQPVPDDLGDLLRRVRLSGSNRAAPGAASPVREGGCEDRPVLALVDPELAAAPRRLRAFLDGVLAACPAGRVLAAGPEGVPDPGPARAPRLSVIAAPADPWALFGAVARVYVARAEAGCEARLAGAQTLCLAGDVPDDALARRYGAGVHWFDPWTRRPIGIASAIERIAWLRDRHADTGARVVYVGISRWKRPALDVFGRGPHGAPIHTMTAEAAVGAARACGGGVRAWATRAPAQLAPLCAAAGLPLAWIEDGFLRSVGLGASLRPGASIVVDDGGIYYDPRTRSRLERLLAETDFPADLVARAGDLRAAIVALRLSKYNVGLPPAAADWPADRRIVLVPGQVEDDASVRHGSPRVRSNLALLRAARARNPDAFLLYKPHPDVEAGFRPGAVPDAEAHALADRVVGGLAIVDLLDRVHHVETMTSLAGFEALLRGLTVAVHGRPFYAGWGLTEDLAPGADRGRRLALDELAAGALILYPRYLDPVAMKPCEPEHLLERLAAARDAGPPSALALGPLRHRVMRARYALLNPVVARLRARRGVGEAPR